MENLKPCPFCGRKVEMIRGPLFGLAMIYCNKCGCRVSFEENEGTDDAAKMWNRRKP